MSWTSSTESDILLRPPLPARPTRSKLLTVCPFILGNEFCERLAYYGLAMNLATYLTAVMRLEDSAAAVHVSLFQGSSYGFGLLGAWVADTFSGRYKTIMAFSMIYAVGMFGMAATALVPGLSPRDGDAASTLQLTLFFGFLYTVAVGTGGIKPNVSTFGAEQFDDRDRRDRRDKQSFFNWFYFAVNVGSLLASTVIVWIQSIDWGIGFAVPAIAMALAVVLFVAGHSRYKQREPEGSPIERVLYLTSTAFANETRALFATKHKTPLLPSADDAVVLMHATTPDSPSSEIYRSDSALDKAGHQLGYTKQEVSDVRSVVRLMPIFFLTILFWTIYTQMFSVFVLQGTQLDNNVEFNGWHFTVPAASMPTFDTLTIISLVPIYDGVIAPLLKRCGYPMRPLQRMGWGFVVAAFAMVAAGVLERQRIAALEAGGRLSILAQGWQYTIVAVAEVLASIGQLEFFYEQAPVNMRSCCAALQLLSVALGSYLSAFIMVFVARYTTWVADLDHVGGSRLDLFFFLLAGILALNTLVFAYVAARYKGRGDEEEETVLRLTVGTSDGGIQEPPAYTDSIAELAVGSADGSRSSSRVSQSSSRASQPQMIDAGTRDSRELYTTFCPRSGPSPERLWTVKESESGDRC